MTKGDTEPDWEFIAGIIVAVVIVMSLVFYFWLGPMIFTEQRQAGEDIVESTYNGDNAVQEYEWFRTQYYDIQAQRNKIENTEDELQRFYATHGNDSSNWSREARTRHGRIQNRLTGHQNMLEDMVAEYNARSSMENRALFKCNLPYRVDQQFYVTGPPSTFNEEPDDKYLDEANPDADAPPPEECDGLPKKVRTDG